VAHHELPQGHEGGGLGEGSPEADGEGPGDAGAPRRRGGKALDLGLTNARLEGMNGLFQAARSRARGYRNEANFIAMIYLIGSPVGRLFDQAKST
jgi:hypothetical protein